MRRAASFPPELPGYTYVKVLGSGGFSDVFLYEQKLPRRRVAVKVLLIDDLSEASRAAFVDEANVMAQLSAHPYIVSIYHADVANDDRPYFVMENCSGPSLAERYKQEAFTVADALRTGVRLSSAIATAHGAGILHRDIKPANVLTNDFGWPALTDFGISSAVEDEVLPTHTGTLADALSGSTGGSIGGSTESASVGMSVPWSPPEMFDDDPRPDVRSDVFSLAATIYTILAGQTPFEVRGRSNGTLDLIGRIERGAISPFVRDDLPRSLVAVLQKGMATDREDRFATAVDFARALQRVELELGYAPTAIDIPNMEVEAPGRRAADAPHDDDATRARSVSTIDAQPVTRESAGGLPIGSPRSGPRADTVTDATPAATPAATPVAFTPPPAFDSDATVARGATRIDAQPGPGSADRTMTPEETVVRRRAAPALVPEPGAEPVAPTEPVAEASGSRGNRLVLVIGGAVLALVAIAVVVSLVVFGPPTGPDEADTPSPTGGAAVLAPVQTPVLASAAVEGADLVFTVTNPDAEADDVFRWERDGAPTEAGPDGRYVVAGYTAGTVCVDVYVQRATRTSNPLEACYPAG